MSPNTCEIARTIGDRFLSLSVLGVVFPSLSWSIACNCFDFVTVPLVWDLETLGYLMHWIRIALFPISF